MATTYIPLYTTTLASATASVTISPVPAGYTDLVLVSSVRFDSGGSNGTVHFRFNGDTSTNYSFTYIQGNGTGVISGGGSNATIGVVGQGASSSGSSFATGIAHIQNYSNTTTNKTVLTRADDANSVVQAWVSLWRNTAAITSIFINGAYTFAAGSTFSLYGVAAASVGAKATGGDVIGNDGTYYYHVFRSSGTFTPLQSLTADYLVIAGGAGGGGGNSDGRAGGGGGAGGYRTSIGGSTLALTAIPYTVTIGAGGAGGGFNTDGSNGSNSVFSSITSTGGGYGARPENTATTAGSGGSGGGAGGTSSGAVTNLGGAASPAGQGNAGGNVFGSRSGGGGGGAGAVGGICIQNAVAGNGGNGLLSSINNFTYAGGGGGGVYNGNTAGTGGTGGGGRGGNNSAGFAATANTGGGGGGGASNDGGGSPGNTGFVGGNGGSGLVIVRYPI